MSLGVDQTFHKDEVEMGEHSAVLSQSTYPSAMGSNSIAGVPKDLGNYEDLEAESSRPGIAAMGRSDDVQTGVKNIEAIAMTWTKWGLIAAYSRSVIRRSQLIGMLIHS